MTAPAREPRPGSFFQFAEPLPEPMLLVSVDGTVLAANPAAGHRLGLHDVAGRPLTEFVADAAEDVARYLRACARSRTMVPGSFTLREPPAGVAVWRADGALVPSPEGEAPSSIMVRLVPREAAVSQFVALNQQIAALAQENQRRRRTEEELRQKEASLAALYAQLRETDRRKDEFLAILAHELRNPLAPIRNGLQLMRLTSDHPTLEGARLLMERQLAHMVRLIDDLLDLSRVRTGRIELRTAWVELAVVIADAVETSRPVMQAQGHELAVSLPPDPILVDGDRTRLAQVFANLLNNAAKYTPRGGRIELSASVAGGQIAVRVRDTGIGIAAEMLPRIFDMFMQVDRSLERSQGGLGVGLTLVKRLVELHGGTVSVHSDGPGAGSEFCVRLPVVTVTPEVAVAEPGAEPGAAGATQPLRVLVADDNEDSATSLGLILTLMGHEVRTAFDGLQAVEQAEAFAPDLAILDVGMPRLNGYDVAGRIRQAPWGARMVLAALTGWGQHEDQRRSHHAGFDHHLVKPIDPASLKQLLAGVSATVAPR